MTYTSHASLSIKASQQTLWDALTIPAQVKQYFFGTELDTTWGVGSPIYFRGVWNASVYEDKGTVLSFTPTQSLSYTYWSSMSGETDTPEHYQTLTYTITPDTEHPDNTIVTIDQTGVASQDKGDHSSSNWAMVLDELKRFVGSNT